MAFLVPLVFVATMQVLSFVDLQVNITHALHVLPINYIFVPSMAVNDINVQNIFKALVDLVQVSVQGTLDKDGMLKAENRTLS